MSSRDFASHFRVSYDIHLTFIGEAAKPVFTEHVPTMVVVLKQPSQTIYTSREE